MTHSMPSDSPAGSDLFGQAGAAVAKLAAATAELFGPADGDTSEEAAAVLAVFGRGSER